MFRFINKPILTLLIFLFGLLLFGPFASNLFHDVMHLPIVIPEAFYLPILFLYKKKMGIEFEKMPNFKGIIVAWTFFLVIAIIWGTYDIVAILSTARSFLLVGIFYVVGKNIQVNKELLIFLLIISVGSIFGWGISSLLNFQAFLGLDEESVVYGNMIAIAYAFGILFLFDRNIIIIAFVFAINVFLSFTTALRRQILVSLLSVVLSLSLLTVKYKKLSYLVFVGLLAIPVYLMMPQIEYFVKESNPYLHHRIFERSMQVVEHDLHSSDQGRIDHQLYIFTKFPELIVPHGYVSQNTTRDKTGIYNDVPTLMLAYTFGVFLFYAYIIKYIKQLLKAFRLFRKNDNDYYGVLFVIGFITLFLHFVESSMFIYTYTTPFTGLTIGLLFRNDYIKVDNV